MAATLGTVAVKSMIRKLMCLVCGFVLAASLSELQ